MSKTRSTWPFKSLDSAVAFSRKTLMFSSVLIWSTAFLSVLIIWLSMFAERIRPEAGIAGPTLPQAIVWTALNLGVAAAVNAWARYFPELFRRRFLLLQERKLKREADSGCSDHARRGG